MNKERAIEILKAYRPGEGLESDPEVRQALDLCERDPEVRAVRDAFDEMDAAFGKQLNAIPVPAGLEAAILRQYMAAQAAPVQSTSVPVKGRVIKWMHPALFGAAAVITIFLALSFTYWNRPAGPEVQPLVIDNPVMNTADNLYANLKPSFVSRDDGQKVLEYLKSTSANVPASMPSGLAWDRSFACDVMEVEGRPVSVICFKSPDKSSTLHLFTFRKDDYPGCSRDFGEPPKVRKSKKGSCATWASDDSIHVLYSDKGEENLRQLLEI